MTWIFLSPAAIRTTSKSVFSPTAAAPPPPPPAPGMAATATGAAADTPHFSWSSLESFAASSSESLSSCSAISSIVVMASPLSWVRAPAHTLLFSRGRQRPPRSPPGVPRHDIPLPLHRPRRAPRDHGPITPLCVSVRVGGRFGRGLGPALLQDVGDLALRGREQADELGQRSLERGEQLAAQRVSRG